MSVDMSVGQRVLSFFVMFACNFGDIMPQIAIGIKVVFFVSGNKLIRI